MSGICLGITNKGKRCNKKTLNGYCKYHISQKDPPDECCVCTDPVQKDKKILCECNSSVHRECIVKSGKSECPVCRRTVVLKVSEKKRMKEYAEKYRKDMAWEEFQRFQEEYGRELFENRQAFVFSNNDRLGLIIRDNLFNIQFQGIDDEGLIILRHIINVE
jgi:hypothetical protein